VSLYAATKQAFEDILAFYTDATPLRVISLHLFDTYGPDDPRPKLIQLLLKAARGGPGLSMPEGKQLLDFVHVDDVVNAFLLAAARLERGDGAPNETFAVSAGERLSLRDLVALVERLVGHSLPVEFGARPYRAREVMQPWTRGEPIPGWAPQTSLESGLRRLLEESAASAR
jgi:nucleoside-diphosphate-sugar epimerase